MKPVMLATDGSTTAALATDTAIELAQLLNTELVIVSVWNIPYTSAGFVAVPPSAEVAEMSEEQSRKITDAAATRAEAAGVKTRTAVLRGLPVEEICLAAETFGPRLLVVGSHGRGVLKRALLGSVSTGVLHHASCPVLVVRGDKAETTEVDERAPAQAST
jgi:nucleotide-binding universal stress UspA family protein